MQSLLSIILAEQTNHKRLIPSWTLSKHIGSGFDHCVVHNRFAEISQCYKIPVSEQKLGPPLLE